VKRDPIAEEELWRSVAVYFVSYLIIGILNYEGYISIGDIETFFWAFILTSIHFVLIVRYRKKEKLIDPSIFSIVDYMFQPKKPEGRNSIHPASGQNFHLILIMAVIVYLIYRYAL
jgi:hypothetical protein